MKGRVSVMDYEDQMKWIADQIAEINKLRQIHGLDYAKGDLEAFVAIKVDYANAQKRSVNLSWIEYPDRMGR